MDHSSRNGDRDYDLETVAPDEIAQPERIGMGAIGHSLRAGWRDFMRAPGYGLFFSAFYVAGGLVLAAVAAASGQEWWLMPFVVGFPLIAPFAAVGLYGAGGKAQDHGKAQQQGKNPCKFLHCELLLRI